MAHVLYDIIRVPSQSMINMGRVTSVVTDILIMTVLFVFIVVCTFSLLQEYNEVVTEDEERVKRLMRIHYREN